MIRRHYVYRCFGAAGRLLYIGCTSNLSQRIEAHTSGRADGTSGYLSQHMETWTATEYPSRDAALEGERNAIRTEAPLMNKHHNLGRGPAIVEAPALSDDEMRAACTRLGLLDHAVRLGLVAA